MLSAVNENGQDLLRLFLVWRVPADESLSLQIVHDGHSELSSGNWNQQQGATKYLSACIDNYSG